MQQANFKIQEENFSISKFSIGSASRAQDTLSTRHDGSSVSDSRALHESTSVSSGRLSGKVSDVNKAVGVFARGIEEDGPFVLLDRVVASVVPC